MARQLRFIALLLISACSEVPSDAPVESVTGNLGSDDGGMTLSSTRLLRRLSLTLRGHEPALAEFEAAEAAERGGTFSQFYEQKVTEYLNSPEYYDVMLAFGQDYLRIGDYKRGSVEGGEGAEFSGSHAASLYACDAGTRQAGKLYMNNELYVDGGASMGGWCNSANARVNTVEPWWAPGTRVSVVGNAGNPASSVGGVDCGRLHLGETGFAAYGCGCGPNLQYCYPETPIGSDPIGPDVYITPSEANPLYPKTFRRMLHEEPSRLFAHLATTDSSFADLVLGDYTVAPRWLQFIYVRWGRTNTDNGMGMDSSGWFRTATTNWDKVQLQALHPNLLSTRTYAFDPRTDSTAPRGIPAAGVLTMLGPNSWYPRERVRAARFLETFACKVFTAPDPNMVFMPPYRNDPKTQGPCQHCHVTIEPAAIYFKRLEIEDSNPRYGQGHANLGGIGVWQWRRTEQPYYEDPTSPGGVYWYQPYERWNNQFIPNTFLTPVSDAGVEANSDARFIDFLPQGATLLGQTSDGTIGPLGFGKIVVASGEFDRCAVERIHKRIVGNSLLTKPNRHTALVNQFVSGDRRVKRFIEELVKDPEFRRGR